MACEDIFSQLVEIEDIEESVWLAATFIFKDTCSQSDYFHCTAWTGGNDILMEGNYGWHHSNSSTAFINWHVEQPSGRHDGREEDCVEMMSDDEGGEGSMTSRLPLFYFKTGLFVTQIPYSYRPDPIPSPECVERK
ncbi:perlucin-like protein [Ostrea edulis]|uniref:perlucin-like protein n=1 Tax=Ostrea edulis TaxID=37623 RepID=UPI0024AEF164|nr:perlucin-like protein [Ostrea edulis]